MGGSEGRGGSIAHFIHTQACTHINQKASGPICAQIAPWCVPSFILCTRTIRLAGGGKKYPTGCHSAPRARARRRAAATAATVSGEQRRLDGVSASRHSHYCQVASLVAFADQALVKHTAAATRVPPLRGVANNV